MNRAMKILITILLVYGVILIFFYFIQSALIFYPQPITRSVPLDEQVEEVHITTAEEISLHGWLSKGDSQSPHKLIIYFGGNAEEVSHLIPAAATLNGWAFLLVNYPGYGNSQGKPGQDSFFKAALAVYDYAKTRQDISLEHIVLLGRSIGTGSAAYLAHERAVRAVIMISPFESLQPVAQSSMPFLPVGLLLQHKFPSKKYASNIEAPLLAFYGTEDRIIPSRHSKKLAEIWKGHTRLIALEGFRHNDIFESGEMWDNIRRFLDEQAL
jgi:uncharacterized protein